MSTEGSNPIAGAGDERAALLVTGATRVFALIGDPVHQVRSPALYNRLAAERGADAVFVPLAVPAARLDAAIAGLRSFTNLAGLTVTIPHKASLCGRVDEASPRARMAGVVNAIRVEPDGRWYGDAFDGVGYVEGLKRCGRDPAAKAVQLVGLGGAGAQIAFALAEAGVAALRITDTDRSKVERVAAGLAEHYPGVVVDTGPVDLASVDIVANATPLGMDERDPLPVDAGALEPRHLVTEMIMKPARTALLRAAEALGCETHSGIEALRGQAGVNMTFFGLD